MKATRRIGTIALLVLVAACAPSSEDAVPVRVALHDDAVVLDAVTVPAGPVEFLIGNQGTLVHEVEVFSGATPGAILPVESSVADTAGLTLLDEVEDILVGSEASLTIDLSPGPYLLMCNLPDHYGKGMWSYLTVTASDG